MAENMSPVLGAGEVRERRKLHPQKFMMWVAIASMSMAFAGLTSGYMVRQAQGNWRYFTMPGTFTISTFFIVISSVTFYLAVKAFKAREISKFRMLVGTTLILGIIFCILQFVGFHQLYNQLQQVRMNGQVLNESRAVRVDGNPSESFLFIIAGLHLLHLLGGIIALIFVFIRAFRTRIKTYNATGLEIAATYWHFVDALWIYLFVFLLVNQ